MIGFLYKHTNTSASLLLKYLWIIFLPCVSSTVAYQVLHDFLYFIFGWVTSFFPKKEKLVVHPHFVYSHECWLYLGFVTFDVEYLKNLLIIFPIIFSWLPLCPLNTIRNVLIKLNIFKGLLLPMENSKRNIQKSYWPSSISFLTLPHRLYRLITPCPVSFLKRGYEVSSYDYFFFFLECYGLLLILSKYYLFIFHF